MTLVPSVAGPARGWLRHGAIVIAAAAIFAVFWFSRPEWSAEMQLWRAVGDTSLILLLFALAAGPLARVWRPAEALVSWRRETGIWFVVLALVHTLLVFDGWFRWDLSRMLGYEFIPQLDRIARMEPGFGLSNLVGLVALALGLLLAATGSGSTCRCCTRRIFCSCTTRSRSIARCRRIPTGFANPSSSCR